jgi:hypothetical protein
MKLYIKRNDGNLEIYGEFPITTPDGADKIGDVEFNARTNYLLGGYGEVRDSVESFKMHELRAR